MPPSHPRPEDLAALGAALSSAADHATTAGESLLDHMVTVGDHTTQRAVDTLVDDAVDALRELAASCRELALPLAAHVGHAQTPTETRARTAQPHTWERR